MNIKPFLSAMALLFFLYSAVNLIQAQRVEGQEYIVQADDWLSKIAEKIYGDPLTYPLIVAATNARAAEDDSFVTIVNPDIIEIGQKLWLPAESQIESGPATGQGLTVEALRNTVYHGLRNHPIQFIDGEFQDASGIIMLVDELVVFGDLNNDGAADAAVLLFQRSSGTAVFTDLAVVLNRAGSPANIDMAGVVDGQMQVKSMTIEGGQIIINIVATAGGFSCCPTEKVQMVYVLQDEQLVRVSRESLGPISGADLDGTTWQLGKLLSSEQEVPPDTDITLTFEAGQISGFVGCNTYTAPLEIGEYQRISIGSIAVTEKACPSPISNQEKEYLRRLADSEEWNYLDGQLLLGNFLPNYGKNLIFTPQLPSN